MTYESVIRHSDDVVCSPWAIYPLQSKVILIAHGVNPKSSKWPMDCNPIGTILSGLINNAVHHLCMPLIQAINVMHQNICQGPQTLTISGETPHKSVCMTCMYGCTYDMYVWMHAFMYVCRYACMLYVSRH